MNNNCYLTIDCDVATIERAIRAGQLAAEDAAYVHPDSDGEIYMSPVFDKIKWLSFKDCVGKDVTMSMDVLERKLAELY